MIFDKTQTHKASDGVTFIKLKTIYPVYRTTIGKFRIGAQADISIEVTDPEDEFWDLIHALDGQTSLEEICLSLQKKHPRLNDNDILQGIHELDRLKFLEMIQVEQRVDDYDKNWRYKGNVNYYGHFLTLNQNKLEKQDQLGKSKVLLLGLGGAGSNILPILSSVGIGQITCVDYDVVDLSNLNRQYLYSESDIGKLKTEASQEKVTKFNSDIQYHFVTRKIVNVSDLDDIVPGMDLVICAIDEPAFVAQRIVNQACVKHNVTCVYGLSQLTAGRVFSVIPRQTGCFDCLNIHYTKNDPSFVEQFIGFQNSHFEPPTLTYGPDILQLSAILASEVVRLLNNYTAPMSIAKQVEYNFIDRSVKILTEWPRYEFECPTCGMGNEDMWEVFKYYAIAK